MSRRYPGRPTPKEAMTTVLPQIVKNIVEAINPLRIILFGSAARGKFGPGSDFDLLVVIRDDADTRTEWNAAHSAASGFGIPVDLVLVKNSPLHIYQNDVYLVYYHALTEGRELFTATVIPVPDPDFPISPPLDWIDLAWATMTSATAMDPRIKGYEGRVYGAFRAASLALKAACKTLNIRFHHRIDLKGLLALLTSGAHPAPPEAVLKAPEILSRYADLEWVPVLVTRVTRKDWATAIRTAAATVCWATSLMNGPSQKQNDSAQDNDGLP